MRFIDMKKCRLPKGKPYRPGPPGSPLLQVRKSFSAFIENISLPTVY